MTRALVASDVRVYREGVADGLRRSGRVEVAGTAAPRIRRCGARELAPDAPCSTSPWAAGSPPCARSWPPTSAPVVVLGVARVLGRPVPRSTLDEAVSSRSGTPAERPPRRRVSSCGRTDLADPNLRAPRSWPARADRRLFLTAGVCTISTVSRGHGRPKGAGGADAAARRLLAAAGAEHGHENRAALLDRALALGPSATVRATIQQLRLRGPYAYPYDEAIGPLRAEARAVRGSDPDLAASLLLDVAETALEAGYVEQAIEAARESATLAAACSWPRRSAQAVLASALLHAGEVREAEGYTRSCVDALDDPGWVDEAPRLPVYTAAALVWSEDFGRAAAVLDRTVAVARDAGASSTLASLLGVRSELEYRDGRWRLAHADASESVAIVRGLGREPNVFRLVRLEAVFGHDARCLQLAAEQERRLGNDGAAGLALALLALVRGRPDEAVEHLTALARYATDEDPAIFPWEQELTEAFIRSGRKREARSALETFESRARRADRASALAAAARCRGLLAESAFEPHFDEALRQHDRCPWPFERARTELCLGERLRRAGQRRAARDRLRSALDTFAALGATPWVEWAQRELNASAESVRGRRASVTDELTRQELQVARTIAGGLTNKEAAAALFVSPKTIEFHLANVYRKLGIRSRSQLVRLFGEHDTAT